jgi:hypothetical protein
MRPIMKKTKMNFTTFVIEAIRNYVRGVKYKDAINASFGAWKDGEHPDLKNGTGTFIRNVRKSITRMRG